MTVNTSGQESQRMLSVAWDTGNSLNSSGEMSSSNLHPCISQSNVTCRRQRLPSTDSDTSIIANDGPTADVFCFTEAGHPNQVIYFISKIIFA